MTITITYYYTQQLPLFDISTSLKSSLAACWSATHDCYVVSVHITTVHGV